MNKKKILTHKLASTHTRRSRRIRKENKKKKTNNANTISIKLSQLCLIIQKKKRISKCSMKNLLQRNKEKIYYTYDTQYTRTLCDTMWCDVMKSFASYEIIKLQIRLQPCTLECDPKYSNSSPIGNIHVCTYYLQR